MELSNDQLELLDATKEVEIETIGESGSTKTIIWVVVVDSVVHVRSVFGEDGQWYQRARSNPLVAIHVGNERIEFRARHVTNADQIAAVTAALRTKYRPGGSLDRMTRAEVLDTTLRLEPLPSDPSENA